MSSNGSSNNPLFPPKARKHRPPFLSIKTQSTPTSLTQTSIIVTPVTPSRITSNPIHIKSNGYSLDTPHMGNPEHRLGVDLEGEEEDGDLKAILVKARAGVSHGVGNDGGDLVAREEKMGRVWKGSVKTTQGTSSDDDDERVQTFNEFRPGIKYDPPLPPLMPTTPNHYLQPHRPRIGINPVVRHLGPAFRKEYQPPTPVTTTDYDSKTSDTSSSESSENDKQSSSNSNQGLSTCPSFFAGPSGQYLHPTPPSSPHRTIDIPSILPITKPFPLTPCPYPTTQPLPTSYNPLYPHPLTAYASPTINPSSVRISGYDNLLRKMLDDDPRGVMGDILFERGVVAPALMLEGGIGGVGAANEEGGCGIPEKFAVRFGGWLRDGMKGSLPVGFGGVSPYSRYPESKSLPPRFMGRQSPEGVIFSSGNHVHKEGGRYGYGYSQSRYESGEERFEGGRGLGRRHSDFSLGLEAIHEYKEGERRSSIANERYHSSQPSSTLRYHRSTSPLNEILYPQSERRYDFRATAGERVSSMNGYEIMDGVIYPRRYSVNPPTPLTPTTEGEVSYFPTRNANVKQTETKFNPFSSAPPTPPQTAFNSSFPGIERAERVERSEMRRGSMPVLGRGLSKVNEDEGDYFSPRGEGCGPIGAERGMWESISYPTQNRQSNPSTQARLFSYQPQPQTKSTDQTSSVSHKPSYSSLSTSASSRFSNLTGGTTSTSHTTISTSSITPTKSMPDGHLGNMWHGTDLPYNPSFLTQQQSIQPGAGGRRALGDELWEAVEGEGESLEILTGRSIWS